MDIKTKKVKDGATSATGAKSTIIATKTTKTDSFAPLALPSSVTGATGRGSIQELLLTLSHERRYPRQTAGAATSRSGSSHTMSHFAIIDRIHRYPNFFYRITGCAA